MIGTAIGPDEREVFRLAVEFGVEDIVIRQDRTCGSGFNLCF